jgi:hypothetical protein
MKDAILDKFYLYDPNEFLPIFVDGQLDNKNEFVAYKIKSMAKKLAKAR